MVRSGYDVVPCFDLLLECGRFGAEAFECVGTQWQMYRRILGVAKPDERLREFFRVSRLLFIHFRREGAHGSDGMVIIGDYIRGAGKGGVIEEIGTEESGCYYCRVNAQRGQFQGEGFGNALDSEFGRAINAPANI